MVVSGFYDFNEFLIFYFLFFEKLMSKTEQTPKRTRKSKSVSEIDDWKMIKTWEKQKTKDWIKTSINSNAEISDNVNRNV